MCVSYVLLSPTFTSEEEGRGEARIEMPMSLIHFEGKTGVGRRRMSLFLTNMVGLEIRSVRPPSPGSHSRAAVCLFGPPTFMTRHQPHLRVAPGATWGQLKYYHQKL